MIINLIVFSVYGISLWKYFTQREKRMRGITLLLASIIVIASGAASAAMDKADLMVGMKTLPLLSDKITGNMRVAILFDPGKENSRHEAEAVKAVIDGGLDLPGDLSATAILVPASQPDKLAGSKIAIITSNLQAYYGAISSFTDVNNILTISTDLDCVRGNKCILGVVSKPHVEIYYSRVAAENSKISFEQAFTILAKPASLLTGQNP